MLAMTKFVPLNDGRIKSWLGLLKNNAYLCIGFFKKIDGFCIGFLK